MRGAESAISSPGCVKWRGSLRVGPHRSREQKRAHTPARVDVFRILEPPGPSRQRASGPARCSSRRKPGQGGTRADHRAMGEPGKRSAQRRPARGPNRPRQGDVGRRVTPEIAQERRSSPTLGANRWTRLDHPRERAGRGSKDLTGADRGFGGPHLFGRHRPCLVRFSGTSRELRDLKCGLASSGVPMTIVEEIGTILPPASP